ncbi:hypothetical protein ACFXHA_06850 [Nocardia sp. NPDC059240]|uniref:WXG100-like domain-containing protein n=1 Tax=Nocardia sp. NPDC059240 TaxID=3346786 RepID=UPI0036C546B1
MKWLNFGAAYPKGDEDQLFALGDALKHAAAELEKLEPSVKSTTDKVPQYYEGDGATAAAAEFAKLFDTNDVHSIPKLVETLNNLGHDARSTATDIEFAKIQSEIFALMTLYSVYALIVSQYGSLAVPALLAAARKGLAEFAAEMAQRIGDRMAMAALKDAAEPLARELAPIAEDAAEQAAKKAAQQAAKDAAEQATKDAADQAAKDAAEQAAKKATEDAAEQASKKAAEDAAEKTTEQAAKKAAEDATKKAPTWRGRLVQKWSPETYEKWEALNQTIAKSGARVRYPVAALKGFTHGTIMGTGLDAATQIGQIMEGHRDDGFNLKQTFQTGIQWGAGGVTGGMAGEGLGRKLMNPQLAPSEQLLSKRMGGLVVGTGGGLAGAAGMYVAGIGTSASDHHWDFTKVDYVPSGQLIAGGLAMGAMGGGAHGLKAHAEEMQKLEALNSGGGQSGAGSPATAKVVSPQSFDAGHQKTPAEQINQKPAGDTGQQNNGGHSNPPANGRASANGAANGAEQRANPSNADGHRGGGDANRANAEGAKPAGDGANRSNAEGAKPAGDGAKPAESGARPLGAQEANALKDGAGVRPAEDASARGSGTPPGDQKASFPAGAKDTPAQVPAGRTPEVKPVVPPAEVRPVVAETATPPAQQHVTEVREGIKPATDVASPNSDATPAGQRTPAQADAPSTPDAAPARPDQKTDGGAPARQPSPDQASRTDTLTDRTRSGDPNARKDPAARAPEEISKDSEADKDRNAADPASDQFVGPMLYTEPVAETPRSAPARTGEAGPRQALGPIGDFRGEARPEGQPNLTHDALLHEIGDKLDGILPTHPDTATPSVRWDPESGQFVLRDDLTGRELKVEVGVGPVSHPDVVAEFKPNERTPEERTPDEPDYHITVSDRARTEDVARAISHELTEILSDEHAPHPHDSEQQAQHSLPEPTPLTPHEIESELGIPEENQQKIQAYADENSLIIEVRSTNPDAVQHLKDGAMPKPMSIKDKTINDLDVELGAPAESKGLVGRFSPDQLSLPERGTVSDEHYAKLEDRLAKRIKDFEKYQDHMEELIDQGLFQVRDDGVIEGWFGDRWREVTGDHDLFDIRHADGTRLTPEEELFHRQALVERDAGIQHGPHVYWEPPNEYQRVRNFESIVREHQYDPTPAGSDNTPLVRFRPDEQPELAWAAMDLDTIDRELTPWHIESELTAVHEQRLQAVEEQSRAHFADKPDATPAERARFENDLRQRIDSDISEIRDRVAELAEDPDFEHAEYRGWLDDTFRTPIDVEIDGHRQPMMFIDRGKEIDPVLARIDAPAHQLAELRQELRNELNPHDRQPEREYHPSSAPVVHSAEEAVKLGKNLREDATRATNPLGDNGHSADPQHYSPESPDPVDSPTGEVQPTSVDWHAHLNDKWSAMSPEQIVDELKRTHGVEAIGFDIPGLHPEAVRELARAVDEMLTRYPDAKLPHVSIEPMEEGVLGQTFPHSVNGRVYNDWVVINEVHLREPEEMARLIAGVQAEGFLVPNDSGRPIHATFVHEFGHVLDNEGQNHASATAEAALENYFESTRPGQGRDAFESWLNQLSGYSFRNDGRLRPLEAVAEAFADVEANGAAATEPAKVLYQHLLDNAAAHSTEPTGFRAPGDATTRPAGPEQHLSVPTSEPVPAEANHGSDNHSRLFAQASASPSGAHVETHSGEPLLTETPSAPDHSAAVDWAPDTADTWSNLTAEDIASRLKDLYGIDADFGATELHPEVVREFARAIADMKSRYPDVNIPRIVIEKLPEEYLAATDVGGPTSGPVSTQQVILNETHVLSPDKMAGEVAQDTAAGHFVAGSDNRPIHATIIHEYGHAIVAEGQQHAAATAEKVLETYFANSRGGMDKAAFDQWLDQLSGYSFSENRLNGDEALAEAFADVELNGEAATEPAKVLYWHLLDSANAHSVASTGFTRIPHDTIARVHEPHRPDQPITKPEEPAQQQPLSPEQLGSAFNDLRGQTKDVVAAFNNPARAAELPTLRAELAEQYDRLGLRSPESEADAWQRLHEHDSKLAEYLKEYGPALLPPESHTPIDPDRPPTLTPHLQGRFDEVQQHINDLMRAYHNPHRAPELPGLRVKFGDLVDKLGLRDPVAGPTAWNLFRQHNEMVAKYVETGHKDLLPTADDRSHAHLEPPAKPSGQQQPESHVEPPKSEQLPKRAATHEKPTDNVDHEAHPNDPGSAPSADPHIPEEPPVRHGTDRTALGNSPEGQRAFDNVRNEGEHDVIVHGDRFGKPTADGGFELDPHQVAEAIRNNPNYVDGTPIRLLSCHSGNDIGWAQHIANELCVPVRAPSDLVGVRAVPDSPAAIHDTAEWRTFHPAEADGTTPEPTVHKPGRTDKNLPTDNGQLRADWDILGDEQSSHLDQESGVDKTDEHGADPPALSPEAQELDARLAVAEHIEIQPGEVNVAHLAELQQHSGVEYAIVQGPDGELRLFRGTETTSTIPESLRDGYEFIVHAHAEAGVPSEESMHLDVLYKTTSHVEAVVSSDGHVRLFDDNGVLSSEEFPEGGPVDRQGFVVPVEGFEVPAEGNEQPTRWESKRGRGEHRIPESEWSTQTPAGRYHADVNAVRHDAHPNNRTQLEPADPRSHTDRDPATRQSRDLQATAQSGKAQEVDRSHVEPAADSTAAPTVSETNQVAREIGPGDHGVAPPRAEPSQVKPAELYRNPTDKERPPPAQPETYTKLPPNAGNLILGKDKLLHLPTDREETYRTLDGPHADGRLHHKTDPAGTFRAKDFSLHGPTPKGFGWIEDHLSNRDEPVLYETTPIGKPEPYEVTDSEAQKQLQANAELRSRQQDKRDPAANIVRGHMKEFDIEHINDLSGKKAEKKFTELEAKAERMPEGPDKDAKLARLKELKTNAAIYHSLGPEMVETSKKMGDTAGTARANDRNLHPNGVVLESPGRFVDGRDTFDIPVFDPAAGGKPPTLTAIECKGVGSELGHADTDVGRARQCTPEYTKRTLEVEKNFRLLMEDTPESLKARGIVMTPEIEKVLKARDEMLQAFQDGTLVYKVEKVHADLAKDRDGNTTYSVSVTTYSLERDGIAMEIDNIAGITRVRTPVLELAKQRELEIVQAIERERTEILERLTPAQREIVESALGTAREGRSITAAQQFMLTQDALGNVVRAMEEHSDLAQVSKSLTDARNALDRVQQLELDSRMATVADLGSGPEGGATKELLVLDLEQRNSVLSAQVQVLERELVDRSVAETINAREVSPKDRAKFIQHHLNLARDIETARVEGRPTPELSGVRDAFERVQKVGEYERASDVRALEAMELSDNHRQLAQEALDREHAHTLDKTEESLRREVVRQSVERTEAARAVEVEARSRAQEKALEVAREIELSYEQGKQPNLARVEEAHEGLQRAVEAERACEVKELERLELGQHLAQEVTREFEDNRRGQITPALDPLTREMQRQEHNRLFGPETGLHIPVRSARDFDARTYQLCREQNPIRSAPEKQALVFEQHGREVEVSVKSEAWRLAQAARDLERGVSLEAVQASYALSLGQAQTARAAALARETEVAQRTMTRQIEERARGLAREL